jgi:hypothetical protein
VAGVKFVHVFSDLATTPVVRDLHIDVADKEFLVFVGHPGVASLPACECWRTERFPRARFWIGDRIVNNCSA